MTAFVPSKIEKGVLSFTVLNSDLKALWSKEYVLPYTKGLFELEEYQVDNLANIYTLGRLYAINTSFAKKGKPNYSYVLNRYTPNADAPNSAKISDPNKFMYQLRIRYGGAGDYGCIGFTANEPETYSPLSSVIRSFSSGSISGVYCLTIDGKTNAVVSEQKADFSTDFLTDGLTEGMKNNALKRIAKGKDLDYFSNFCLNEVIERKDGGFVLIAEQSATADNPRNRRYGELVGFKNRKGYHYYNDYDVSSGIGAQNADIILVALNASGKIDWERRLFKRQATSDIYEKQAYSYSVAVTNNQIHIICNVDPLTMNSSFNQSTYKTTSRIHWTPMWTSFDFKTGHGGSTVIAKKADSDLTYLTTSAIQTGENELTMLARKESTEQFISKLIFMEPPVSTTQR